MSTHIQTNDARLNFRLPADLKQTIEEAAARLGQSVTDFAVSTLAYLRRKRSTRPAVSNSFCLPVKNGWQFEQISTPMSPLWVDRVVNALPQAQWTRTSL